MTAPYRDGTVTTMRLTAGSAGKGGDVILTTASGFQSAIATQDYVNGEAIDATVGGVHEVTAAGAIASGARIWWDPAVKKVTTTPGSLTVFGIALAQATGDGVKIRALHWPIADLVV